MFNVSLVFVVGSEDGEGKKIKKSWQNVVTVVVVVVVDVVVVV